MKVHNSEGMSVHDISVEQFRTYFYSDGSKFTIEYPETLYLKQDERGDSHRVVATAGSQRMTFYIRRGWVAIGWVVKEGEPDVAF